MKKILHRRMAAQLHKGHKISRVTNYSVSKSFAISNQADKELRWNVEEGSFAVSQKKIHLVCILVPPPPPSTTMIFMISYPLPPPLRKHCLG